MLVIAVVYISFNVSDERDSYCEASVLDALTGGWRNVNRLIILRIGTKCGIFLDQYIRTADGSSDTT